MFKIEDSALFNNTVQLPVSKCEKELVIVKQWQAQNRQEVILYFNKLNNQFSASIQTKEGNIRFIPYQQSSSSSIEGTPSGIRNFRLKQLQLFFADTYIRLHLSSSFVKLSILQRGRGGVTPDEVRQELQQCDNNALAARVKSRVPLNTYTSIEVRSVQFNFGQHTSALPTREISLELTKTQALFAFLRNFFSGLGLIESMNYDEEIDEDDLQRSLVNTIFSDNLSDTKPIEEAYKKATSMHLYIAEDASAIHLQFRESGVVRGSYRVGKAIKLLVSLFSTAASVANSVISRNESSSDE